MSETTIIPHQEVLQRPEPFADAVPSPTRPPRRRLGRLASACIMAVGTVGMLVAGQGEVAGREHDVQLQAEPLNTQDLVEIKALADTLPAGPCAVADDKVELRTPFNCAVGIQNGRTALVSFGMPVQHARHIAAEAEQRLSVATDGIVGGTITAIPASPAAEARFTAPCVNTSDLRTYGSVAAELTMGRELQGYSQVLAISTKPECDLLDPSYGVAELGRHRNAEVILGPLVDADPTKLSLAELDAAADILTHEKTHLEGLGHAGAIITKGIEGDVAADAIFGTGDAPVFDVTAYVEASAYRPYKGQDVMSGIDDEANWKMNAVHQSYLRARASMQEDGVSAPRSVEVGPKPTAIDLKDAEAGAYGVIPLDNPLYAFEPQGEAYASFDALAIVPEVHADQWRGSEHIGTWRLYALNSQHKTVATIGDPYATRRDTATLTFGIGDKQYKVASDYTGLQIVQQ